MLTGNISVTVKMYLVATYHPVIVADRLLQGEVIANIAMNKV